MGQSESKKSWQQTTRPTSRGCLAKLLVLQTAAATQRVLCASVCLLLPMVLGLTLFTCSGAVSLARFFKCLAHHPLRGGTTVFFLSFFFFSLSICFNCFFFLPFIECVCRACRIQYDDMALHCPLLCLLHSY